MTGNGWRRGLGNLARDVLRILFVYALVLQTLAPLAVVRAEANSNLQGHAILCSAMAEAGADQPVKAPVRIVHDCLSCCLGTVVGVLDAPTELPVLARFSLPIASRAPTALILPEQSGSPPPQRAPPSFA